MVAGALIVAGLLAWAPWSPRPAGEGGTGRAALAAAAYRMPAAPRTTGIVPAPRLPLTGWIATLSSDVGYAATPAGAVVGTLPARNPFGAATVLGVIGRPDSSGWLHVELPIRPNGSSGWVPTGTVRLTWTAYAVHVDLASRTVVVTNGDRTVVQVSAAVGASRTPTPPDETYLWELVRPDNPHGAYGPYIFGLAEFSDAYATFNGGEAQIGLHGNDDTSSIGRPVSHGCVRIDNGVITELAGLLPLGTPVSIT